jgi:hypothetical protein
MIFTFIATNSQLHKEQNRREPPCRKAGGLAGPKDQTMPPDRQMQGNPAMSAIDDALHLPPTFNRLAWSNLAAQSAEQIALAAAPIVAVLLLGVGEGQTGLLQTALTLPFILFAIPRGAARRPLLAAPADGWRGSLARRGAALNPAADLARPADIASARPVRLRRGMRHDCL